MKEIFNAEIIFSGGRFTVTKAKYWLEQPIFWREVHEESCNLFPCEGQVRETVIDTVALRERYN